MYGFRYIANTSTTARPGATKDCNAANFLPSYGKDDPERFLCVPDLEF